MKMNVRKMTGASCNFKLAHALTLKNAQSRSAKGLAFNPNPNPKIKF